MLGALIGVCALLGLAIGSFLNVVIYRVPEGMSVVHPPSHCPTCGTELRAVDNVPLVSWVLLRGRCRACRAPISVRYPLVELGTAMAFVGLALAVGAHWALPPLLVVAASVIAASAIDMDGHVVPWPVVIGAGIGAAALLVVAAATASPGRAGWALLGALLAWLATRAADRTPGSMPRALTVGALGWCAGWLWAPGGPLLAAWVVVVAVAVTRAGPWRWPHLRRPLALAAVAAGAYGLLLAGAVVGV
ncbi:MAG TPA: prepilin peptidase, partial [Acidimicrobiales bacterium]|nr:prepilin peptidase [Acidimicrobiales bacterium]